MAERECRPDGEQFAAGNDQRDTQVSYPFDLEGNLKALIDQERARSGEQFNAASWMRHKLYAMSCQQPTPEARTFLWDLTHAYDTVAFSAFDPDTQDTAAMQLRVYATAYDRRSIALNPFGMRLLDALAAATDIPDYTPGQQEIDLSRAIDVADLFGEEAGQ